MAEYIEKDKAKELVCEFCTWVGTSNCEECEHPVDDVTAADVVTWEELQKTWKIANHDVAPVRHGRWLPVDELEDAFDCSECDAMVSKRLNYCPNCGAKMDKEEQ